MDSIEFDSFTWPKRKGTNEDSIVAGTHLDTYYFGIADGVGGSIGGSIASKLAVKHAETMINKIPNENIQSVFRNVHDKLKDVAATDKNLQNMATTLTFCVIRNKTVSIGHVGDSRLYLLRNSRILYKTNDQTLLNKFLNKGMTIDSLIKKQYSNMLSSVLSPAHEYELEEKSLALLSGDRIVICSDGVYKVVNESELVELSNSCETINSLILKIKAVIRIRGIVDDSSLICIECK